MKYKRKIIKKFEKVEKIIGQLIAQNNIEGSDIVQIKFELQLLVTQYNNLINKLRGEK